MSTQDISINNLLAILKGPILVIGASGFIGSNLLRCLLRTRQDAIGTFFSDKPWRLQDVPSCNIKYCNLLDDVSLGHTLSSVAPRTIFDCSAFGAYSFENNPVRIHTTNYLRLISLMEALKPLNLAAYIHAGSSSEYGCNAAAPSEDAIFEPNSHYAVSKEAASLAIHFYGKIHSLPVVNLRLYSVYGPWEDSSRLIPVLCRQTLEGHLPRFARPETSRDFIHVNDVVRAFFMAAARMEKSLYGESFNIGTGRGTSLRELAELSRKLFAIDEQPIFSTAEARSWDVDDWRANGTKALQRLGFAAAINLEEGLRDTREWWRSQLVHMDITQMSKKTKVSMSKTSVSAVIACYKDNKAIPVMYKRLTAVFTKLGVDYEIIFVNDCSPDDTAEVIRRLSAADPHVIGINHSRNFGSQAAFRSGMELAGKESVVLLDGDLQDPPELIESFVKGWRNGADVVYGRRVRREMPRWLDGCYKLFYRIFAKLSEIPIPADAGDFSLIDRKVVHWMLQCRERDAFLRGLRAYVGFRQVGVDYVRPERMFGVSTNNWIRNIGWAKKAIFSFTRVPLHIMTAFGFLCTIGTIILGAWSLAVRIFSPENAPRGITTILLVQLLFGSTTLLSLGLLGEYIGKIFEETKARPSFIRRSLIVHGEIRAGNSRGEKSEY